MNINTKDPNSYFILSGNQAIARACIEAGVKTVTGYPGSPSTEVIETLMDGHPEDMLVCWQINEKVAFEFALGTSWAGKRALVTMKQAGLNVALDSIISASFSPISGGLIIYVADDPGAYYGMVEQDSRYLALMAHIPVFEPANSAEAINMVKRGFEMSEKTKGLVMIRGTTGFANSSMPVKCGQIQNPKQLSPISFAPNLYTKAGSSICVIQHKTTVKRLKSCESIAETFAKGYNPEKANTMGIIASGVTYLYTVDILNKIKKEIPVLKLGMSIPLPIKNIISFSSGKKSLLILEETEPVVESSVRELLKRKGISTSVFGRKTGTVPSYGELTPEIIEHIIIKLTSEYNNSLYSKNSLPNKLFKTTKPSPPAHKPSFCPGCPHTATYLALKSVILEIKKKGKECIVTGDIGCTILGMNKPYEVCWTEISMGASIGIAHGLSNHLKDKILVACIGDSSFLHNGIIALINAVHNKANITVIIMDNRYTAMTGHQPNAGSWKEENPTKKHISIKKIARATGAKFVKSTDPYLFRYTKYLIKKAILYPGTAIIICRRACPKKSSPFIHISFRIISKKCKKCAEEGEMKCIENIACPALKLHNGLPEIDPSLCEGCGICAKFCDHHAIVRDIKTLKISIRQNDKIKR